MSERNDGGPAFPTAGKYIAAGGKEFREPDAPGMSLRDYFATAALPEAMARGLNCAPSQIAGVAYVIADAMLAERAK